MEKLAFAKIGEKFKLIEENIRSVFVLFREAEAHAIKRRLRAGERPRPLLRELGRYSVNVYDDHFWALPGRTRSIGWMRTSSS